MVLGIHFWGFVKFLLYVIFVDLIAVGIVIASGDGRDKNFKEVPTGKVPYLFLFKDPLLCVEVPYGTYLRTRTVPINMTFR